MDVKNVVENARYLNVEGRIVNSQSQPLLFNEQTKERAEAILKALQGLSYTSAVNLLELCEMAIAQVKIN